MAQVRLPLPLVVGIRPERMEALPWLALAAEPLLVLHGGCGKRRCRSRLRSHAGPADGTGLWPASIAFRHSPFAPTPPRRLAMLGSGVRLRSAPDRPAMVASRILRKALGLAGAPDFVDSKAKAVEASGRQASTPVSMPGVMVSGCGCYPV